MPDIRTLLHDAAPQPVAALDMAAVRSRAARRPRRRLVTWLAGLGAVIAAGVGVGIPGGGGILVNAGQDDRPAVIESDSSRTDEIVDGTATAWDPSPGMDDEAGFSPPVSSPSASSPASVPHPLAPTAAPSAAYPPMASCSVDNRDLGRGHSRSCRFTATTAGGWNYYQPPNHLPSASDAPTVSVRVTRDGSTTVYSTRMVRDGGPAGTYHLDGCTDDVIEPGDLVEVVITEPYDATVRTEMGGGAGEHWGCTEPGP